MIINTPLMALGWFSITLIVIAAILLIAVIVLYIVGKKAEKTGRTRTGYAGKFSVNQPICFR